MNSDLYTPILSICIPTFNRADPLRKTLASLVRQAVFSETSDVEIVVSDNNSTDNTWAIVDQFRSIYPGKIKAYRPPEGISGEANFEFVLSKGSGSYLKLHNDNLAFLNGSLAEIVKLIRATSVEKPVIFFTNGNMHQGRSIEVLANINDFVRRVSYFSTWIGGFGMWREEFQVFPEFLRSENKHLVQTDVLFRLLSLGKRAVVVYEGYFSSQAVGVKGGYNIAEVFGKNYLEILKALVRGGLLDPQIFEVEKKSLLLGHIIPYYFDGGNNFHKTGFFRYMLDYTADDYFYEAIEARALERGLLPEVPTVGPVEFQVKVSRRWRELNGHNETYITRINAAFDFERVKVGRRSYGGLAVFFFEAPGEQLSIGRFVSIADDVKFLLGGNHRMDGFSTFPFEAKYFGGVEATSKGAIIVEDDVWIGFGSTLLSGITIGRGAVIAAGSVVNKSVLPYSLVAGNPARHVRFRFQPEIIDRLMELDYSRLSDEVIVRNRDILYESLSIDNVDFFLGRLNLE